MGSWGGGGGGTGMRDGGWRMGWMKRVDVLFCGEKWRFVGLGWGVVAGKGE